VVLTVIFVAKARKLWTTGDIAKRLGVTRQYALQIVNDRRRAFPEEFDTLPGRVQVWLIEDVEDWIARNPQPQIAEDPES
jgi:predicted DNA-binding transcriptional regulator AlpA